MGKASSPTSGARPLPQSHTLFIMCLLKKFPEKADLRDPFLEYMYLYSSCLGFSVSHWVRLPRETGGWPGPAQATS